MIKVLGGFDSYAPPQNPLFLAAKRTVTIDFCPLSYLGLLGGNFQFQTDCSIVQYKLSVCVALRCTFVTLLFAVVLKK